MAPSCSQVRVLSYINKSYSKVCTCPIVFFFFFLKKKEVLVDYRPIMVDIMTTDPTKSIT